MSKKVHNKEQNKEDKPVLGRIMIVIAAVITLSAGVFTVVVLNSETAQAEPEITVYKSPTCGCCGEWVKHIEKAGFETDVRAVKNVQPYKKESGVPGNMASCHTARVSGYFIEGHVPAEDIQRLLRDKPDIAGLTVPGMPLGSPGMEVPGRKPMAYKVYAVDKAGKVSVFANH